MDRPIKGGDILISRKGEILEKKGEGYDSPYQLWVAL